MTGLAGKRTDKELTIVLRNRVALLAAAAALGTLALTACGPGNNTSSSSSGSSSSTSGPSELGHTLDFKLGTAQANHAPPGTGDFYRGARNAPAAMKWVQLTAGAAGPLNPVVVDGAGFTLYRFDKDTAQPSKSNCNDACATTWPPVLVRPGSKIFLSGVERSAIGVVRRDDGDLQVTIGGWPVYRFSKDIAPGQTNGEGVGGTWFGVTPDGAKALPSQGATHSGLDYLNGTAQQNNAPANTGDFYNGPRNDTAAMKWVQLSAGSAGALNPIVHDGADFTLYRFDKDTAQPSKSNCNGACATTWPPVLVRPGSKIFVDGVPASQVGVVRRDDGGLQVTIGGWPVYRFSKDTAPGQTNGEGVGGTWFAVSPAGQKVLPMSQGGNDQNPPQGGNTGAPSVALGSGSVILDSGTNFQEPNGSIGVSGPGCRSIPPFPAKSAQLLGGPIKIWSKPNCTGTSAVLTASVPDLSAIGFTEDVASVRFAN